MTAEVFTAISHAPSTFALDKNLSGGYPLTSDAVTALGAMSTSDSVVDVLQILSDVTAAQHVVGTDSIGYATSVRAEDQT